MSRLPIVTLNKSVLWSQDVSLRQKCRLVNMGDKEEVEFIQSLIREMFLTLYTDPSGVALAAPQVGVLLQLTVINFDDREAGEFRTLVLINPKVTPLSDEANEEQEICLSVPNFGGKVSRANAIKVEAYDQVGQVMQFTADGFFARVIQHEVDHLGGILCIDRVKQEKVNYIQEFPERNVEITMKKLNLKNKK